MPAKPKKEEKVFTVVLVYTDEDIEHHTLNSLEEVNTFIRTSKDSNKNALVFVVAGTLIPESQWRLPDTDDNEKYWTII